MTTARNTLCVTWSECHAIGLTLLGDSAWDIAVGDYTGAQFDAEATAPFEGWDERVHDYEDPRCSGIDAAGAEAIAAWWLAMTSETLAWWSVLAPAP